MSGVRTLDYSYLRSLPGILKLCALLSGFVGLLCILIGAFQVHLHNFRGVFYMLAAILGILCTGSVLLARLFQLWKYKFYEHELVKYEMYLHTSLATLFFIASATALSLDVVAYSIATFFGFLAAISYGCDAFLNFQRSRQRDAATQT